MRLGYDFAKENFPCPLPIRLTHMAPPDDFILIDGNTAAALGCVYAGATVGAWYSYQFQASGSPTPTYGYSGTLPAGLGLNSSTGVLSGTATTAGTSTFWIYATNSAGTAWTGALSIGVTSTQTAPTFTAETMRSLNSSNMSSAVRATGTKSPDFEAW